jgi:hypothetical protein
MAVWKSLQFEKVTKFVISIGATLEKMLGVSCLVSLGFFLVSILTYYRKSHLIF